MPLVKYYPILSVTVIHSAFGSGFTPVATVKTQPDTRDVFQALEQAYEKTNTFDAPWYLKDGLEVLEDGALRSTSCGDYMKVNYSDGSVGWFTVSTSLDGFDRIFDDTVLEIEELICKDGVCKRNYLTLTFRALKEKYDFTD